MTVADPIITPAVAGDKIKATPYNTNFTNFLNYIKAVVADLQEYVLGFVPSQTGNAGKVLKTDGTTASWATDVGAELAEFLNKDITSLASSGTLTLTENSLHTANFTGATTINMFTQADGDKPSIAFVLFKTNSTSYPTFSGATFDGVTLPWDTSKYNLVTILKAGSGISYYFANHRTLGA